MNQDQMIDVRTKKDACGNNDSPNRINMWTTQPPPTRFNKNIMCANVDFGTYHNVLDLKYGGLSNYVLLVNDIFPN